MKPDIRIKVPIFNTRCDFYFKDRKEDYFEACGVVEDGSTQYVDGLACGRYAWIQDPADLNTVLHELSHVISLIMERKGIKDEETRAYLQGYVGGHLFKKMGEKFWKPVIEK